LEEKLWRERKREGGEREKSSYDLCGQVTSRWSEAEIGFLSLSSSLSPPNPDEELTLEKFKCQRVFIH